MMRRSVRAERARSASRSVWFLAPLLLGAAATSPTPSAQSIQAHVVFLAHDLLEGRGPGSRGGELASLYIATEMAQLGLAPGGDARAGFSQVVPLFGVKTDPATQLVLKPGGPTGDSAGLILAFGDDWVGSTAQQKSRVEIDAPVVFAGYGISAPEQKWDDWKDADVAGKAVVMLVNDPPATAAEPALFGGRALTYYGRWSYKYEEAARRGAAAVILVHTDESAGYGWNVVRTSNGGWRFDHEADPKDPRHALALRSWMTHDAAKRAFAVAGKDLDALRAAAASRGFEPVDLGLTARVRVKSETKVVRSSNVVGLLPGRDKKLAAEYVVVTAHWDHLGLGEPDEHGDTIYNGAVDNATGVGGMLGIAEALAKAPPKRSVLFLATTAEEQGLLGADWWTAHPTVPLEKVVANVNLDPMNAEALVDDIVPLGAERSTLAKDVAAIAAARKLLVTHDPRPEQGMFYRSDHFPFARKGVPAVSLKTGAKYRGKPASWAEERFRSYNTKRYHQPSDHVTDAFDWSALAQHAEIAHALVTRIANAEKRPVLDADDEFAPKR